MRKTLTTSPTKPAPLRILLYSLPLWGGSILLIFAMPLTGIVSSIFIAGCLLVLPFKAKQGEWPSGGKDKLFPFSGMGGMCKSCGQELVLRGKLIHLLEPKSNRAKPGSGRGNQPIQR
ncbi:MAG: hypothetical protein L3J61_03375 [Ghiorsea sp.]|nr:hypothetical protein [Ghiorsea sp.]